jgi:hypothetical protein
MRSPGFYWVRRFRDDPEFTIAQFGADGLWVTPGDIPVLHDSAFVEIDERQIERVSHHD